MGFIEMEFLHHACHNELDKKNEHRKKTCICNNDDVNDANVQSEDDSPLDDAIDFFAACLLGIVEGVVSLLIFLMLTT